LRHGDGFRWGAGLRLWGIQVAASQVPEAIEISPDDDGQAKALEQLARAAWLAAFDLDALALWLSPAVGQDQRRNVEKAASDRRLA